MLFMINTHPKCCVAGRFADIVDMFESKSDQKQPYAAAEEAIVRLSDGSFGFCYEIYMGYDTKQELYSKVVFERDLKK